MNEELYQSFENYFNNEMSQEEKLEFELQLQKDAQIKEKFEIYKEINGYLDTKFSPESDLFQQNLKNISEQHFSNEIVHQPKVITFKPWYYAVAASLVIFLGTWFYLQNATATYSDFATHETAFFTDRGEVIKNLKLAEKAYNNKNYKDAITNFELVLKQYDRPEINYFYAICLLEENRFNEAEQVFTKLKNGTSIYNEKAIWQLALSSLKQNKFDECKTYINQLSQDAEDYEKAQKLLSKLD